MLFDNLDDFDFSSLYPSILREFNIAPNTQIGMIVIPNQIYANENPSNDEKFSRGGKFLEDLHSGNYLEFCSRWFKVAGYSDLYKDIVEYYTTQKNPVYQLRAFNYEGLLIPYNKSDIDLINPIAYNEDLIRPYIKYKVRSY